jgi:predicted methyltransferase
MRNQLGRARWHGNAERLQQLDVEQRFVHQAALAREMHQLVAGGPMPEAMARADAERNTGLLRPAGHFALREHMHDRIGLQCSDLFHRIETAQFLQCEDRIHMRTMVPNGACILLADHGDPCCGRMLLDPTGRGERHNGIADRIRATEYDRAGDLHRTRAFSLAYFKYVA